MKKTAGNFNANVPTAKIVVTFLNSERPPVNIESPLNAGHVNLDAIAIGVGSALGADPATSLRNIHIREDGRGGASLFGRLERFVWAQVNQLDPEPVVALSTVEFHAEQAVTPPCGD